MRLLQLLAIIGAFFALGQYTKPTEVPVAAPIPVAVAKPQTISDVLQNLKPHPARGYVYSKGHYTRIELEPTKSYFIMKFFAPGQAPKQFVISNISGYSKDPYALAGSFSSGNLLYLRYSLNAAGDRIYSGWIISPDRTSAAPLAVVDGSGSGGSAVSGVAGSGSAGARTVASDWPSELDVSKYMTQLK